MKNLEKIMLDVAYEAGNMIRENAFDLGKEGVEFKKIDDPVSLLDTRAENLIRERIKSSIPDANFIGEEYGTQNNGGNTTWIIDPIDGTKSFVKKIFDSSLSIGVEVDGNLSHGLVYDFMKDIMYFSGSGGRKLFYQKKEVSYDSLMSFSKHDVLFNNTALEMLGYKVGDDIKWKKQEGSIALSLAQVAFGIHDGIVFSPSKKGGIWDIAGGYTLLKSSPDIVISDYDGNQFDYKNLNKGLIALNKKVGDIKCLN